MKVQFPTGQTPILCQGITTASGAAHIERALAYGSNIVSGVSRDKGVSRFMNIPVFSTVKEAVRKTKPQISVIFSSPSRVLADTEEAIKAQIPMVICTTTHVPYHDILRMRILAQKKTRLFNWSGFSRYCCSGTGSCRKHACRFISQRSNWYCVPFKFINI